VPLSIQGNLPPRSGSRLGDRLAPNPPGSGGCCCATGDEGEESMSRVNMERTSTGFAGERERERLGVNDAASSPIVVVVVRRRDGLLGGATMIG